MLSSGEALSKGDRLARRTIRTLLAAATAACATSWHVAPDGDDARSSAQAQNPATPWKTLAHASTAPLQPGDSLLLARDGIWHEALTLGRSGTATSPVVVAAYGPGTNAPQLRGTVPLSGVGTGWGWSASFGGDRRAARLFDSIAGPVPPTRFPDSGWLVAGRVEGDSALACAGLAGKDWTGASIHLRTQRWTLETHRVLRCSGNRIVLDGPAIYGPPDSVRFYLTDHAAAADARTGWYQDSAAGKVFWNSPRGNIEVSAIGPLVETGRLSHVVISGLSLFGARGSAVHSSGTDVRVVGCEILFPSLVGVESDGSHAQVASNSIRGAGNGAVVLSGTGHRVEGNAIRSTAQKAQLGPEGMGDGCCGGRAIDVSGDSAHVSDNTIDSTGYIGIGFRGAATLVERNDVGRSCMTTDDCAGIYTWTGPYANTGSAGSVIRRNFVHDAVGAQDGWPEVWEGAQGIYLDDGTHDVVVDTNASWNNGYGLQLHNNQRCTWRGNTVFGNRTGTMTVSHDDLAGVGDMTGNLVADNLLVALPGQGSAPDEAIYQAQTGPLATYTGDVVCSDQLVSVGCTRDGAILWNRDRIVESDPRLGPQTQRNFGFDSTRIGWTSWPSYVSISRDTGTACGTGKCLRVVFSGDPDTTESPLINTGRDMAVAEGQAWRLSLRARGQDPAQHLSLVFRRGYGDYAPVGLDVSVDLSTEWRSFSFLFRTRADSAARLDIHDSRTDSVYWIDDISLRSVPDSLASLPPAAALRTNPTGSIASAGLGDGTWIGPLGNAAPASPTLDPWGALVAFDVPAGSAVRPRLRQETGLHAWFRSGTWEIEGLTGTARVVDSRGRLVAQISPDPSGRASWRPTGGGPLWLRGPRGSVPLLRL
jgi:parallel beta-helix repeat protein